MLEVSLEAIDTELGKEIVEPELVKQVKPKIVDGTEDKKESKTLTTKQITIGILLGMSLYVVSAII